MSIDHRSYSSGTRNTRRGRPSRPNQVYHVTMVTRRRARLFTDLSRGRVVVDAIRKESESGRCATLCFVVMPDHVHWLVRITEQGDLSKVVRRVKADVSSEAERLGEGAPNVWQNGFHDHAMRSDEDLVAAARYIVANPLRAGLVRRIGNYPLWDAVWL